MALYLIILKKIMAKLKKAFEETKEEAKTKEVSEEVQPKIERVKNKEVKKETKSGCFKKNIMHKGQIFMAGSRLDNSHKDYEILKKHLS